VPIFEFATNFDCILLTGDGHDLACAGGGGSGLFNLNASMGIETDVSGCKLLGQPPWLSGDALIFAAGPRIAFRNASHWTPWFNVLIGGEKLTQESISQKLKDQTLASAPPNADIDKLRFNYARDYSATGLRLSIGGGVDYALNSTVAFRMAGLEYSHRWAGALTDVSYPDSLRLTMGMMLRLGN